MLQDLKNLLKKQHIVYDSAIHKTVIFTKFSMYTTHVQLIGFRSVKTTRHIHFFSHAKSLLISHKNLTAYRDQGKPLENFVLEF